jgi:hypothetical protein
MFDPTGLQNLLDFADSIIDQGDGYWAKKFKYAGQRLTYDHKHQHLSGKGVPYVFVDAHQLLKDFFIEVDQVLALAKLK